MQKSGDRDFSVRGVLFFESEGVKVSLQEMSVGREKLLPLAPCLTVEYVDNNLERLGEFVLGHIKKKGRRPGTPAHSKPFFLFVESTPHQQQRIETKTVRLRVGADKRQVGSQIAKAPSRSEPVALRTAGQTSVMPPTEHDSGTLR